MTLEEVYEKLCVYDKRSPYWADLCDPETDQKRRDECFCDNCFYGRDRLALEILRLREKLDVVSSSDDGPNH
jgi:hypothetical protein